MDKEVQFLTAEEYFEHKYVVPGTTPVLPLADEGYLAAWREGDGKQILPFLKDHFNLPAGLFDWQQPEGIYLTFKPSLAGHVPVIQTTAHEDFCCLAALLNGRDRPIPYGVTINACMMQARHPHIYRHRILLMNKAPYSNVSADRLGLGEDEWLEKSCLLRLRHECAHYETLRLFGGMKNHVVDEIIADGMGQIAAFGNFSAHRQRLFFGLTKGSDQCDGRLAFYCRNVWKDEHQLIYRAVDQALERIAPAVNLAISRGTSSYGLLQLLADPSWFHVK